MIAYVLVLVVLGYLNGSILVLIKTGKAEERNLLGLLIIDGMVTLCRLLLRLVPVDFVICWAAILYVNLPMLITWKKYGKITTECARNVTILTTLILLVEVYVFILLRG